MATKIYYFEGTCQWAKVQSPTDKYDPTEGKEFCIDFFPKDEETKQAIVNTGTKKQVKNKGEGDFFTFNCEEDEPPKVIYNGEEFDGLVGNGSRVTVKIAINKFTSKKWGKVVGTKLRGVRVDELVEYEPDDDDNDNDEEVEVHDDDDIPF